MNASRKTTARNLLLLILALSLCLGLSAQAESGTLFPWLTYTLDVELVSADPAVVDFKDVPDGGVMVLVKLKPLDGTVLTTDIQTQTDGILLRDRDGDEYAPHTWRVRGIIFDTKLGLFSVKDEQTSFELLYFLQGKDAAALSGAKLLIPGENEGERIVVALDKAPHEPAAEGEAQPAAEPAAEPTAEPAAEPTAQPSGDSVPSASAADAILSEHPFVLGGIRYIISALDDTPSFMLPNQLDGKEGHVVRFTYAESGAEAETANGLLFSNARLREPGGRLVRAYSNSDNIGNPYELYFGLSDNVLLADCAFTIQGDEGPVEISLAPQNGSMDTTANP